MNRLIALEICSAQHEMNKTFFDDQQVNAYMFGLSSVYHEVLIVSAGKRVAIWVVGEHQGLLINSFERFNDHCHINLFLNNDAALNLLAQIFGGDRWNDCNQMQLITSMVQARDRSIYLDALGPVISNALNQNNLLRRHGMSGTPDPALYPISV